MSRWDKIEKGDIWNTPEGKGEKKSNTKEENKKEKSTSEKGPIILPDISLIQNSIEPNTNPFPVNISGWLSQFSFGQITMVLLAIPIVVVLVCISFACVKFFLSPIGNVVAVAATGVAFIWIMKRGGIF